MNLMKINKVCFYILSCTWGVLITFIGLCTSLVLILLNHRPKRNYYGWYFEIGENWGGVNLGLVTLANKGLPEDRLAHEFGHSIQNCMFGPLYVFIVAIPSVIRYWFRKYLIRIKHRDDLPEYDSIWFEGQATRLGSMY